MDALWLLAFSVGTQPTKPNMNFRKLRQIDSNLRNLTNLYIIRQNLLYFFFIPRNPPILKVGTALKLGPPAEPYNLWEIGNTSK